MQIQQPTTKEAIAMVLAQLLALAEARSCLAALADTARTTEGSSAYEHALMHLDWIHADDVPALDTVALTDDRDTLVGLATSAIEDLVPHGANALQIELILAMLDDARSLDEH